MLFFTSCLVLVEGLLSFLVDNFLTEICVLGNSRAKISHMSAPPFMQHPSIQITPSEDIQHTQISLISRGRYTRAQTPLFDNLPRGVHSQVLLSTNVTVVPQISSSVNDSWWSYFMGVRPFFSTLPCVHHQTRPSQDFVAFQSQRQSLPTVSLSRNFQDKNIPAQNSSRVVPFAHRTSPQISSSHAGTNFHSHLLHSDRSISISQAVHQAATLQPQAQVGYSAAFDSLLPPSDFMHNLPTSSLRVTSSDAHHVRQSLGCHRQNPHPLLVRVPSPSALYPNHPHSFVEQNLPTFQARCASFESAYHGQLHLSNNRTVACDPQVASSTQPRLPSTVPSTLHPMQCSTTSGTFPMFSLTWNDVQNPNMPFHRVVSSDNRNIPAPTQTGANWSSTLRVQSRNVSFDSRHPMMQAPEAKLRGTTSKNYCT